MPAEIPYPINIERLSLPAGEDDISSLARLLIDAVESGAAVSFLAPLSQESAENWWRKTLTGLSEKSVVLVARNGPDIVGTVQFQPAWAPNQPHRAEVAKLIVHRSQRGKGLGSTLMRAIEKEASAAGFWLLTLDTKRGTLAELLYYRLGWICAGIIPRYAYNSDGSLHDTVIFYKEIHPDENPKPTNN